MKILKKYIQLYFLLILFVIVNSCSTGNNNKLPITTSSKPALENYLKGLELNDKLRRLESRKYFEKAIEEDPEFALAHLNLAFVQPTTKSFMSSFNNAKKFINKVSDGEKYWILGYEAGAISGNAKEQEKYYNKLVKEYPNDERVHLILGNFYFFNQEYKRAIKEYKIADKINPELSPIYNQMGYAYRYLERYDESETAFQHYISLIPDDPNPYDSYAELLMKVGKFNESINNYEKALQVDSNFFASYSGIASNLNLQNNHEQAKLLLENALLNARDEDEQRRMLTGIAISYIDEGNYSSAIKTIKKQYEISASSNDHISMANDYLLLGQIYLEMNQPDKALEFFKQALKLIEEAPIPKANKNLFKINHLYFSARVYIAKGNIERARTRISKFGNYAKTNNNQMQILLFHELNGLVAMHEKEYHQAIKEFLKANQQNPYTLYRLAKAYSALGKNKEAMEYYQRAANFYGVNNINYAFIRNKANRMIVSM
ncbi:MAG: hypothetical protein DRP35_06910 [Candidatus Zixiibacteriota bacterium]|nr:MAG: hypothetical protein DRP35_06910 [candidate division Zixibacteria bacterium]